MQMTQEQAGYRYFPGMTQDQANEIEQIHVDQATFESLQQWQVHPTPGRNIDGASSSYPPPGLDPTRSPPQVDPTDGLRRSQRERNDPSRFSHSDYPDHVVHAHRGP